MSLRKNYKNKQKVKRDPIYSNEYLDILEAFKKDPILTKWYDNFLQNTKNGVFSGMNCIGYKG